MTRRAVSLAAGVVFAATAIPAHALDPTATVKINGATGSFMEYAGSDPVGVGEVDTNKLFFIDEKTVDGVKSWYVFFDPKCKAAVYAEITFSNAITGLITTTKGLYDTNSVYGISGVDYESVKYTGLEKRDYATYSGNTLKIHWKAGDPGDHIRVMTAVPEPQTYALLLAGLGAMTLVARRRKAQPSPTPA
jgi:PEP-CTERM motif